MTNRSRDPFFDDFDKSFNRAAKGAFFVWVAAFVVSSAISVGLVWVAWHFVSKFW